jgi:hypothetical protein
MRIPRLPDARLSLLAFARSGPLYAPVGLGLTVCGQYRA